MAARVLDDLKIEGQKMRRQQCGEATVHTRVRRLSIFTKDSIGHPLPSPVRCRRSRSKYSVNLEGGCHITTSFSEANS